MIDSSRPSKKQRELLTFIDNFIAGHGYGPSYREIQSGLGYASVSTVAIHINNLMAKGLLTKRTYSARSLEVSGSIKELKTNQVSKSQEKWLIDEIDSRFLDLEESPQVDTDDLDELYVLIGALKVLGFSGAATSFKSRLADLKKRRA